MNVKERRELAARLIEETRRIGESIKDLIPEGEHLSLVWWPDGHTDILVGSVNQTSLSAFSCSNEGRVTVL